MCHRSRHCLPVRPGRCDARTDHFRVPWPVREGRLGGRRSSECPVSPADVRPNALSLHRSVVAIPSPWTLGVVAAASTPRRRRGVAAATRPPVGAVSDGRGFLRAIRIASVASVSWQCRGGGDAPAAPRPVRRDASHQTPAPTLYRAQKQLILLGRPRALDDVRLRRRRGRRRRGRRLRVHFRFLPTNGPACATRKSCHRSSRSLRVLRRRLSGARTADGCVLRTDWRCRN